MSNKRKRTSDSHPIRVDFLDAETMDIPGRLGMTIAPGMKARSERGDWNRDLETDLLRLKERYHADALVTLLEEKELREFGTPGLIERAKKLGFEVVHFPIVDVSTPRKAQTKEYMALVERIIDLLRADKVIVVHCRGGLGRTGTVAASVLVALGHEAEDAISIVRSVRSQLAVETREQEEYVREFEKEWRAKRTSSQLRRGSHRVSEQTQIERYRGCLLGLAAGDALGTTVEFESPGTFRPVEDMVGGGKFGLRAGRMD